MLKMSPSNLKNSMFKAIPGESKRAILTAMNNGFQSNTIRDSWRLIKIVPIRKSQRNHNDIANFRSNSLISVYIKCINLMILRGHKIYSNQFSIYMLWLMNFLQNTELSFLHLKKSSELKETTRISMTSFQITPWSTLAIAKYTTSSKKSSKVSWSSLTLHKIRFSR